MTTLDLICELREAKQEEATATKILKRLQQQTVESAKRLIRDGGASRELREECYAIVENSKE